MTQPTQPTQPTSPVGRTQRPTRHDRTMFRLMNDPAGQPLFATAGRRRAAVAAHVALTAAVLACMTLLYAREEPWLIAPAVPALLLWTVATGILNGGTRGLLELRTRMLDERQLADRARARAGAHRAATALLAAAAGVFVLDEVTGADALSDVPVAWTLVYALAALWLLPLWTAALQARDEPEDD